MTSSSDAEALAKILISLIRKEAEVKKHVISTLSAFADELNKHSFNTKIANLTFASTGIVATGLTVAGLIAALFTFGASLGLTIGGVALGVTSAAGTIGTTAVGRIIQKANDAREYYKEITDMLLHISKVLDDDNELLQQVLKYMNFKADVRTREVAKLTALGLASAGGGAMRLTAVVSAIATRGVLSATTRTVASVLKTGLFALSIGGAALSVLTLPLDIYILVKNSVDIHKKTPGEGATELRDAVKKLMKTDLCIDDSESQGKDLKTLMKENSDLKAEFVCLLCFVRERDVIYLPCGHVVCCQECNNAGGFSKCPMCREVIRRYIIAKKDPESAYLLEVDAGTTEQLIQMNRKLKFQRRCMVCNTQESNVLFLPCNHIMACSDCSNMLSCCFVCDTLVQNKKRIYA